MSDMRILVIEDDYDIADLLLEYFGNHQIEVFHAADGPTGIEMARTEFPKLILLDIVLPGMDGYDVCQRLRRMSLTRYIPIIFLTKKDGRVDRVRGLELGADDYITKPFDVDELLLRVQGSMRRATRSSLSEPRTGLPTGLVIDDEIVGREQERVPYTEIRLGIEGLDAYRDVYGFMAADDAFGFAGRCIQEIISTQGSPYDFIGVVEDQFIILTHVDHASALEEAIKERFATSITTFYNFIDVEQGGVVLNPGTPEAYLVPLMSFSSLQASV
ncbi:MAG: response regulator transcription factor [Anaerolineae bacterium]|nr:response regulator transcription factor [Anaerolineae bacterium]